MITIRHVKADDKLFWYQLDKHLPEAEFENKVKMKRGYILLENEIPAGLLRHNLFWDNIPFCTLVYINIPFQGNGYGKMLMEHWEDDMRKQGYGMLLTSTQADETAQHFYRKLGYKDCGSLMIDVPRYAQSMELFLVKEVQRHE